MNDNLPSELKLRLPQSVQDEVEKLAEQGWQFQEACYESFQADPYWPADIAFKSPNMVEWDFFSEVEWKKLANLKQLFEAEAEAVAKEWVECVSNGSESDTRDELVEDIKKCLLKRKDAHFEKPNGNITTIVKIAPKNIHKPKNIEITIKIT
jgi:hypothetical protein